MLRRMSGPSLCPPPEDGGSLCESDGNGEPKDGDGDGAEDVEAAVVGAGGEVMEPLLRRCGKEDAKPKIRVDEVEASGCRSEGQQASGRSLRMVLGSTVVTVCGSFEFGTCVGYSAPTQSGIIDEVGPSISEVCDNIILEN